MNLFKHRVTERYDYPQLSIFYDKAKEHLDYEYLERNTPKFMETAIYIHVPFCDSFCLFCNYYKERKTDDLRIAEVANAIKKELEHYSQVLPKHFLSISAIHFGGGTPTCLGAQNLSDILNVIRKNFSLKKNCMVSIESHVRHLKQTEFVHALKESGFNRISFGVQSFDESIRKRYGLVPVSFVEEAFDALKASSISDVNIDLMYGFPGQSCETVISDIDTADTYNINCIDLYSLNVFPGTYMEKFLKKHDLYSEFRNITVQCSYQQVYQDIINKKDYHFVMSNTISKRTNAPNEYLRIHLGANRYEGGHVIGIGPSSRGYLSGYAYKNNSNIDGYLKAIEANANARILDAYLTDFEKANRTMVMFPNYIQIQKKDCIVNNHIKSVMDMLIRKEIILEDHEKYYLPTDSLFWAGNISALFYSKSIKNKMVYTALMNRQKRLNMYNQDKMQMTRGENEY